MDGFSLVTLSRLHCCGSVFRVCSGFSAVVGGEFVPPNVLKFVWLDMDVKD